MKIKYLGPGDSVEVGGFGRHLRGQVKDYPEEAGRELLATSKRQQFEEVVTALPGGTQGDDTVNEIGGATGDAPPAPVEGGQEAQGGTTAASEGEPKAEAAPEGEGAPAAPPVRPKVSKGKPKPKGQGK
jgi:hypothetical protein